MLIRLHLFYQKYRNSNTVKYYYNLEELNMYCIHVIYLVNEYSNLNVNPLQHSYKSIFPPLSSLYFGSHFWIVVYNNFHKNIKY